MERTHRQGGSWRSGPSHIRMQINQEEQLGSETDRATQGSRWEIKLQNLIETPVEVEAAGETPSLTGESVGETHRVLEHTQTHPPTHPGISTRRADFACG